jgi:hypothetical protein
MCLVTLPSGYTGGPLVFDVTELVPGDSVEHVSYIYFCVQILIADVDDDSVSMQHSTIPLFPVNAARSLRQQHTTPISIARLASKRYVIGY